MTQPSSLTARIHPSAWQQTLPVVLGYLPIGFAFGILAIKAGISTWNTMAMSVLVFAGSAQLISVGLFAAGVSPWSIILTTFVVNLRHLLMSAALSPYMQRWKQSHIALFAFELTDETFGLHTMQFSQAGAQVNHTLAVNQIAHLAWITGTGLGIVAGDLIHDVERFGLDYALVAMFTALLVFQIKDNRFAVVAILAGVLSVFLATAGINQWNVILATVIAATVGVLIESWTKKPSS